MMPDQVRGNLPPYRPGRKLSDPVGDRHAVVSVTSVLEQEAIPFELRSDCIIESSGTSQITGLALLSSNFYKRDPRPSTSLANFCMQHLAHPARGSLQKLDHEAKPRVGFFF